MLNSVTQGLLKENLRMNSCAKHVSIQIRVYCSVTHSEHVGMGLCYKVCKRTTLAGAKLNKIN